MRTTRTLLLLACVFGWAAVSPSPSEAVERNGKLMERVGVSSPGPLGPQAPLPGPRPYYGRALGATYYNWGYFGARQHYQFSHSGGYYGSYKEWMFFRGY